MQTTRSSTRCKRYTSERKHLCLNNSSSKAEDVSAYTLAAWVTEIAVKRKSGCRKPRYRRLRDVERSRHQRQEALQRLAKGEAQADVALPAFACSDTN